MYEARYPEAPDGETLPDLLAEAGWVSHHPSGSVKPLEWVEMQAFAAMTGVSLHPFFWRLLREMSAAYVSGLTDDNPLSIPPMERPQ